MDKTRYLAFLMQNIAEKPQYKFIRPRRFGKTSLISLISDLCQENPQELFRGTELESYEYQLIKINNKLYNNIKFFDAWTHLNPPIPYFTFDFKSIEYVTAEKMEAHLENLIANYADQWNIQVDKKWGMEGCWKNLLIEVYKQTGKQAFVLIDEYDCPLMSDDLERPKKLGLLKRFYGVMKGNENIQFAFVTGITDNDLMCAPSCNHFNEITLDLTFAEMCGYTEEEVKKYVLPPAVVKRVFPEFTEQEFYDTLKELYCGFCFNYKAEKKLYNPYSVLQTKITSKLYSHWAPQLLLTKRIAGVLDAYPNIVQEGGSEISGLTWLLHSEKKKYQKDALKTANLRELSSLWVQGFLTIGSYDDKKCEYTLKPSNLEVREVLLDLALDHWCGIFDGGRLPKELKRAAVSCDFEAMLKFLNESFPGSSRDKIKKEKMTHCFYTLFRCADGITDGEVKNADGNKCDMRVEYPNVVFLIELKLNTSAEDALKQVLERNYAYIEWNRNKTKRIIELGINYDINKKVKKHLTLVANEVKTSPTGEMERLPIYPAKATETS